MLSTTIRKRLDRLTELPAVPFVISELLNSLEDQNIKAKSIASLIERDQTLTARVLRVANSPFYGFVRKISTIELAVVLLGLNTIKEIVVSLILQRLFTKAKPGLLEIHLFWQYSVFCGTCSRMLARRMGYRLAGEAFVAGLMHDIGILIINEYFSKQMLEIKKLQGLKNISLTDAEKIVLDNTTHCDIGAWFAEKWNLPDQLCDAIRFHHSTFYDVAAIKEQEKSGKQENREYRG